MATCDVETLMLEFAFEREHEKFYSPDYVPADIAHLDLALPPTWHKAQPLPPNNEADKVYAVLAGQGRLLGVLTSPVDAAEAVKKLGDGAFMQACVLNAI